MRVVVVDDNVDVADIVATGLRAEGFVAEVVTSEFRTLLTPHRWDDIDVAFVDYHLAGMTGTTILRYLEIAAPHVRRVLISADTFAPHDFAHVVLDKPFTLWKLVAACRA